MEVITNEKYSVLKDPDSNVTNFLLKIEDQYHNFESCNLILDFSSNINVDIAALKLCKDISKKYKKHKKSLVIIANNIDFNKVPNYLTVVPTLLEAIDIIEMEEIERDLGF